MPSPLLDFSGTHLTLKRPIGNYTKVQMLWGSFCRRFRPIVRSKRIQGLRYFNVGCGPNLHDNFVNVDYWWQPGLDVCCDITSGIRFPAESADGIFTEHCLEHITFEACQKVLREFRRLLRPGGILRVVIPDAELFLSLYMQTRQGRLAEFPFQEVHGRATPMMHVNRIFRDHGHLFAYDFETLKYQMEKAGFKQVARRDFRQGTDNTLLIDSEYRRPESLYIEAIA